MPIMDGFESTRLIKKSRLQVPIVAMTANVSADDQRACLSTGMDGFLTKPLTIESLSAEILRHLKPEPAQVSIKKLDDLASKIGEEGKTKVVRAFLGTLPELRESLDRGVAEKNVEQLHRLGHKFKSSTMTVGAEGLTYLLKRLENTSQIENLQELASAIKDSSHQIESKFSQLLNS